MTIDTPSETATTTPEPRVPGDPHGRAALLLVESLIHGLIRRNALTNDDAIQIVELAAEVDEAIHDDIHGDSVPKGGTITLLHEMASSLKRDVGR